ncbi:hypothetical protein [Streptomyces sp. NPDC019224]|uniref:hypothetical protein n=1 Tax=Streptomyces sp. NPDC019224 TaxID=3154484 RepID=UPI00340653C7
MAAKVSDYVPQRLCEGEVDHVFAYADASLIDRMETAVDVAPPGPRRPASWTCPLTRLFGASTREVPVHGSGGFTPVRRRTAAPEAARLGADPGHPTRQGQGRRVLVPRNPRPSRRTGLVPRRTAVSQSAVITGASAGIGRPHPVPPVHRPEVAVAADAVLYAADHGAHGTFDHESHRRDPQLWASRHPARTAALVAGALSGATAPGLRAARAGERT